MADCTELEKMVTQLARNIATDPDVKHLGDVVVKMQKLLPDIPITYQYLSEAMHAATTRQNKEASELQKKINAIGREARGNVNIQKANEQLNEYLETGEFPAKKPKKSVPMRIEQLSGIRNNLRKWLNTSDPAMEKKLNETLDDLNKQIASGEITVPRRGELHAEVQKIQDEINKLREQIRESKGKDALRKKIDVLQGHLDNKTLPEVKTQEQVRDEETQQLQETVKSLRTEINRSEPARKKRLEKTLERLESQADTVNVLNELQQEFSGKTELGKNVRAVKREFAEKEQDPADILRNIIFELREQLPKLSGEKRASAIKQIESLENALKRGDILPKIKPDLATNKEIEDLVFKNDLLRKEIQDEIRSMKPLGTWGKIGVGVDMMRLVMTTGEFSFALRQGGVYAMSHPLKWGKTVWEAGKAFGSARSLYNLNKKIFARDNAPNYKRDNLVLLTEGMALTKTEEVIMNYWMDKLPVFRNFNRAAIAFFNKTRADMYDAGYQNLSQNGEMTAEEGAIWANYINIMTGRGTLGIEGVDVQIGDKSVSLEPIALLLNRTFFSARYVASRFQFIGGGLKVPTMAIASKNKKVYRQIAREYIRFAMGLGTVLSLGLLAGADIEWDPRATDAFKLKFGNRRLDPLMGFGQTLTYLSRLLTGTTKTSRGDIKALRPKNVFFYDGDFYSADATVQYGGQDVEKVFGRFFRSKLSPQAGIAWNIATGENYLGEEITWLNQLTGIAYPMAYGDIWDVMQEDGMPVNVSLTLLTLLGMGLQTYDQDYNKSDGGWKMISD